MDDDEFVKSFGTGNADVLQSPIHRQGGIVRPVAADPAPVVTPVLLLRHVVNELQMLRTEINGLRKVLFIKTYAELITNKRLSKEVKEELTKKIGE